ncbi:helix-turn-helix domain-containing protein [Mycobacterium yunnanensis]|uniref:Helix-turn-helix domain-containing protein n=1 Tax=Mycobacterium yunnanensis TaxID=368477 RepID=A0A9X2Z6U7_9MYCO|nr:helix-turn-helix transcriptional regulator [Mycobacterium yunnanensis]MCV7423764.1 helix-turn-helix domain-containing protein [Mycobacterium yunnanensis]
MDRKQLADFLRSRREALQPEDVGLGRGQRRRTAGLRREEVAALSDMSADYYSRLEQQRGPRPSTEMLAAIARGLRLSLSERDHLFGLAGFAAPPRGASSDHIGPGLMRIFDRLADTPAEIVTALGETLAQTPAAVALSGDLTSFPGLQRSIGYRWFADPHGRDRYHPADHDKLSRGFTANLRMAYTNPATRSRATAYLEALLECSPEFTELWHRHEIVDSYDQAKRILHPELGLLELQCQVLTDPDQGHSLLVFTATPGTPSHGNLALLTVVGHQSLGHTNAE